MPHKGVRSVSFEGVDALLLEHAGRAAQIRRRLGEFAAVPEDRYFYELAYCLLTPQSSAEHAASAVADLEAKDFLHRPFDAAGILREKTRYIRFHHTKARRLVEAVRLFPELLTKIRPDVPPEDRRAWLVGHVDGFGLKEATHFLRNVGRNGGLAILDRHILKNLRFHGVIDELPQTLTDKRYRDIEKRFQEFAEVTGIPLDELDLLFWSRETGKILK